MAQVYTRAMKSNKYSVQDLKRDFPTDEACLAFIFDALHSRKCSCGGEYRPVKGRRQFQCSKCRFQIAPASGTIFHKSDTPLTLWFHALFVFSNAKSGVSAKQLERELGVTYKCAWRILSLIRKALTQNGEKLKGDVETDGAYFGGRFKSGRNNAKQREAIADKSILMAAVERGGNIKVEVVKSLGSLTATDFIIKNVEPEGTRLMTDKSRSYDRIARSYERLSVDHHRGEYVRGNIHVNNIETFWAHVKRSLKGVNKVVSKKHLQAYLDGFVWHYNKRHNDRERFASLLGTLLHA